MTAHGDSMDARLARLPGVDVLRGLAIVLVVLHHTGLRIPLAQDGATHRVEVRVAAASSPGGRGR